MEDEDGGRELMEMYREICRIDPNAKYVIHRIISDLLSVTNEEAAKLELLFKEYVAKSDNERR